MRLRIDFEAAPVVLSSELLSVVSGPERLAVLVSVLGGQFDRRAISARWSLPESVVDDAISYLVSVGVFSLDTLGPSVKGAL